MRWILSPILFYLSLILIALLATSSTNAQAPPLPAQVKAAEDAAPEPLGAGVADAVIGGAPGKQPRPIPVNPAPAPVPAPDAPANPTELVAEDVVEKEAAAKEVAGEEAAVEEPVQRGTVFNGQHVPHITDLSGKTFHEEIANGYWLVDLFSPYCHHCKSLAPKYQTLWEFYYTSDPLPASSEPLDPATSLNSFSRYYNLKFAALDCVAFGSTCSEVGVKSFPTLTLFKDGKEVKSSTGDRSMASLSTFIEECLEMIRPGSRPQGGLKELPLAGAHLFQSAKPEPAGDTDARSSVEETGAEAVGVAGSGSVALKKPTLSKHDVNPLGKSIILNAETFDKEIRKSLNPWFVKFYVPWCHHCQLLAPGWAEMARDLTGKVDVGEVNCDVEKNLCRDYGVRSYPTLMYFRGPEHVEYEGMRGVGDLISWSNKAYAASTGVQDISAHEFERIEASEGVIFLYFYDHATTSEDFMALERLPLHLIGRAKLFKTDDAKLVRRFKITTWPRLLVSRSGKSMYFDWLMPQEMRNIGKVVNWMQSVWLPLVPELTAANARDILDGKYAVLGILNRDRPEEMAIAQRELLNAAVDWIDRQAQAFQLERQELRDAKQLRIEEAEDRNDQRALRDAKGIRVDMNEIRRKEVRFAWVDGIFWERWIRTTFGITVRDGERVIINDEDNHRYWDHTITGNPIVPSRTSILETLPKVVASPPKLTPKPNGSRVRVALFRVRNAITSHRVVVIVAAVVAALAIAMLWLRGRRKGVGGGFGLGRRGFGNTSGFFQLEGNAGRLLGGGLPNGKAD